MSDKSRAISSSGPAPVAEKVIPAPEATNGNWVVLPVKGEAAKPLLAWRCFLLLLGEKR